MRNIYPKIDSKFQGIHALKKYIDKYKGVEIQLLSLKENTFTFEEEVRTLHDLFPDIKEVTIHPPVTFCALEIFLYQKEEVILKQLEEACKLSFDLQIQINLVYHIDWSLDTYKKLSLLSIKKMINQIRGYQVYILLENTYEITFLKDTNNCTPLQICKLLGEKQLKVCFDICHAHISANIRKEDIENYMNKYINKEDALKYIYQVHFSSVAGEDGYKDLSTHGILHKTRKELTEDIELLDKYGMNNCNIVPEISEKEYDTRKDQIKEIEVLEDICEILKN